MYKDFLFLNQNLLSDEGIFIQGFKDFFFFFRIWNYARDSSSFYQLGFQE